MDEEELQKILKLLQEGAEKAGVVLETAVLHDETGERFILDNRKKEDIN